jgi:hypothetical protein
MAPPVNFLRLQVLDWIPFQRKMVKREIFTETEWDALKGYHAECLQRMMRECTTDAGRAWLNHEVGAWMQ